MSSAQRPVFVIFGAIVLICAIAGLRILLAPKELAQWRMDVRQARAESVATGRPVLMYFTASWCGPCQKMKTTTFADERVAKEMKKFIALKIDEAIFPELLKEFSVDGFPCFVVLNADGKEVDRSVGYEESPGFLVFLARAQRAASAAPTTRGAATRAE